MPSTPELLAMRLRYIRTLAPEVSQELKKAAWGKPLQALSEHTSALGRRALKVPESDPATPLGPGGERDQVQASPTPKAKAFVRVGVPNPSKESNRPLDRPDRPSALP
jgi:hypothetical protein